MNIHVTDTKFPEVKIIDTEYFKDPRGFFIESYVKEKYEAAGIVGEFVQDNHSRSSKHVLRGLHFQAGNHPQAKLIRCTQGKILDVAVDIRAHSPTFGEYVSLELSEDTMRQVFIPVGFAHGFLVLSESADLQYKTTDYYSPEDEGSIHWSDPDLSIPWPVEHPIVSNRDMNAQSLKQYLENPAFLFAR